MTDGDLGVDLLDRAAAEALAGRICARAAQQAVASCQLLELIGEFDAGGGLGFLSGVKSVAHWIAYSCSMSPGAAREHVRVARAMRRMPTITAAFRAGELSYSKVREVTRVVDLVDEARLCELARAASASQLARMVSGYRAAAGTRIIQEQRRRFRLAGRDADSMRRVSGQLPAEEAGIVAAALQRARDLNSTPPPKTQPIEGDGTPAYHDVDALLDICQHYLNTAATDDESGEDRGLMIIQVAAEQLLQPESVPAGTSPTGSTGPESVPAGTSRVGPGGASDTRTADTLPIGSVGPEHVPAAPSPTGSSRASDTRTADTLPIGSAGPEHVPAATSPAAAEDVPAGTSPAANLCTVRGIGRIEPETARRRLCTDTLLGAIVDARGDVLALGRTRRLVSKAQRRALMLRDQTCQFPNCASSHHLQAHHVIGWSMGGPTDLPNLILLCQFHHTCTHEGRVTITPNGDAPFQSAGMSSEPAWLFTMPNGERVDRPGWPTPTADRLAHRLSRLSEVDHVDRLNHPDAATIQPKQYGERFDLHAAVRALFDLEVTTSEAA